MDIYTTSNFSLISIMLQRTSLDIRLFGGIFPPQNRFLEQELLNPKKEDKWLSKALDIYCQTGFPKSCNFNRLWRVRISWTFGDRCAQARSFAKYYFDSQFHELEKVKKKSLIPRAAERIQYMSSLPNRHLINVHSFSPLLYQERNNFRYRF